MKADTPIALAAAKYGSRGDALADFDAVKAAKSLGEFDHMAVAVLTKDSDGNLQIERHDTTAKHLAWVGAALVVLAPPVGVAAIAGGAGAGALVGHFWNNIPKAKIEEAATLLSSGESGLIVVAVNRKGADITSLLSHAEKKVVIDTVAGNLDAEMEKELQKAKASV
ncbi:MAG: DUF1269 domain-containing protein [Acidimicrobiia bacterium]